MVKRAVDGLQDSMTQQTMGSRPLRMGKKSRPLRMGKRAD